MCSSHRELLDHRNPRKLLILCHSYLETYKQRMHRPVCEVADMETRSASRYVDPVLQHSWRHYVGLVRDPVEAGPVGFVGAAVEHVVLIFVTQKAGAQRFIIGARASNRHF